MKDVVFCDKLRGAGKQALIRRFPNEETHHACMVYITEYIGSISDTRKTEISKYPEEKTSTEISLVVTSETETVQWCYGKNWNCLETQAIAGNSPVQVKSHSILE
jgi:hypothetical protein